MSKATHRTFRLPHDVREWIEAQARLNASSQNSEVIRAIRERMERARQQEAQADG